MSCALWRLLSVSFTTKLISYQTNIVPLVWREGGRAGGEGAAGEGVGKSEAYRAYAVKGISYLNKLGTWWWTPFLRFGLSLTICLLFLLPADIPVTFQATRTT